MAEPLTIKFDELRTALLAVLANAEASLGGNISLDRDYYWSLPAPAAFDMSNPDPPLLAGQLSDDVETVTQGGWPAELAFHDLGHLIGLLRYVEELLLR